MTRSRDRSYCPSGKRNCFCCSREPLNEVKLAKAPAVTERIPFSWYNMHDYDTDEGAQPPSEETCHRWAHEDGLCDCDEIKIPGVQP